MSKIRILLIEDNRLFRDGLAAILNGQTDMKVVAALGGNGDAILKARVVKPQVVLINLGLHAQRGMHIVKSVSKELPEVRVIGMGLVSTQLDVVEFVQAGVSGFVMKDATRNDVLMTIRTVAKGGKIIPPPLTGSLFSHLAEYALKNGARQLNNAVVMTKRERDIMAMIAEALSNKEIALRLNISTYTVKSHVHNILEKLALHSRLQISACNHSLGEEL